MVKVQCRVKPEYDAPADLHEWMDCENMPDLHDEEAAQTWLTDNHADELTQYGIEFQIIPVTQQQMSAHVS